MVNFTLAIENGIWYGKRDFCRIEDVRLVEFETVKLDDNKRYIRVKGVLINKSYVYDDIPVDSSIMDSSQSINDISRNIMIKLQKNISRQLMPKQFDKRNLELKD